MRAIGDGELAFTPDMCGAGSKTAGGKEGKKHRHAALDKLAQLAQLPNRWRSRLQEMKGIWDSWGVENHREKWAELFLQKLNDVRHRLGKDKHAFENFMVAELDEALGGQECLLLPATLRPQAPGLQPPAPG